MPGILEVKHLDKSFGGVHAVNDVSFHLEKGEILGLIGPNGSGKSTTVNLINGTYMPDKGDVLFEGKSVLKHTMGQRFHMGISRTFQTPKPFTGLKVFDSVYTVALQKYSYSEAKRKADEVLVMMDLAAQRDAPCQKLPIEKRKWLDMARILVMSPKVLMLDEVMAGLNPSEIGASIELVRRVNEMGVSIIFIEHVMKAVVQLSHRIVVLNEGRFLCEGAPETVMNDVSVIKAYLGEEYAHAGN